MLNLASSRARLRARIPWTRAQLAAGAGLLCLLALIALLAARSAGWRQAAVERPPEAPPSPAPATTTVSLTDEQMVAAHIQTTSAEIRQIQDERRVPGRIGYNESRRLQVRLPADGVVVQVLVKPGDAVKKGDQLAILSSVDVGLARDEVVKAEADSALARRERDWAAKIADNLERLQLRLQDQPALDELEREFQDKPLGDHRDKIISAYSRYLLAKGTLQSSEALTGALPEITIRGRRSDKEIASASYHGICEQSRFDAVQRRDAAQADLEHAERLVAVSRQKLRLQLGPFGELSAMPSDATLCEVVLRSSLDGFVEQRLVTDGVQFTAGQNLFVLANVDTLWVSAQIYEREWADFDLPSVASVGVDCPAVPGQHFQAVPLYVSVGASEQSHAVPVVAELENPAGRLKPGMFAWVTVPFGASRSALVIPASALARHESQTFVFVAAGDGGFRKADVQLGLATASWVEILSGVAAGDPVVSDGVFYLKSAWLLGAYSE